MKKKIKMKLFTDYICPWCYLGDAVVKNLENDYDVEIEHIGFELHPDTAPEGNDLLKQFPGSNEMFDVLRIRGKKYGLSFANMTVLPNSRKALIVGEYAKDIGKGEEFVHAMWDAYFKDGKNIGEHQVIVDTAQMADITEAEVNAALENELYVQRLEQNMREGMQYGVNSVPTFIIADQYKVVGAQPEDAFRKVFEEIEVPEIKESSGCENGACQFEQPSQSGEVKKIQIELVSIIDGEFTQLQTAGEYKLDGDTHLIVYTDYTGNVVTKNGIHLGKESMLLHRVGGVTGDMLFDLQNDTLANYNSFSVETDFVIHTDKYEVTVGENGLEVYLCYSLTDKSNNHPIYGAQRMMITMN